MSLFKYLVSSGVPEAQAMEQIVKMYPGGSSESNAKQPRISWGAQVTAATVVVKDQHQNPVRRLRAALGYNQQQLATAIGCPYNTSISQWERNICKPRQQNYINALNTLAEEVGIDLDFTYHR